VLEDIAMMALGAAMTLGVLRLRRLILDARETPLNLQTLSPLERLVLARHTGGTMSRPDGGDLTRADYHHAMDEARGDERRLADLCDALRKTQSRALAARRRRHLARSLQEISHG
jgi:hypothetical protein